MNRVRIERYPMARSTQRSVHTASQMATTSAMRSPFQYRRNHHHHRRRICAHIRENRFHSHCNGHALGSRMKFKCRLLSASAARSSRPGHNEWAHVNMCVDYVIRDAMRAGWFFLCVLVWLLCRLCRFSLSIWRRASNVYMRLCAWLADSECNA